MTRGRGVTTAYLALGSNVGDRRGHLGRACELLQEGGLVRIAARSAIYETESVEGGGANAFLNAVLRIETTLSPRELLAKTQAVETALGRPQPPRQGERPIDVDILMFEDETIEEPGLHVPHPRMYRRSFVLKPLLDVLEGGWVRESSETWPP